MPKRIVKTAIVGCGNIADRYVEQMKNYDNVALLGFADIDQERARFFAKTYGGRAYASLEELLGDADVEVVINLTIHHAHVAVIKQCLEAGKHVYTEKPLAMRTADAKMLVVLAEKKGVRLSSAPITWLGEAQQTAAAMLKEGRAGKIRLAYAEVNHGRIETWHPNPEPFYDVGIVWDVAVYSISMLTAFLGPVRKVTAFGAVIYPDRVTLDGRPFTITTPDTTVSMLEFEHGTLARLTANFYAIDAIPPYSVEFHGDKGMFHLERSFDFSSPLLFAPYQQPHEQIPLRGEPYDGTEYGRGLKELADAICEDRPHRASAAHAAHVVEIICAIHESIDSGKPVAVSSDFPEPQAMPWAN